MRTVPFSAEHDQLRAVVRRIVDGPLGEQVRTAEAAGLPTTSALAQLGAEGLLGLSAPAEVGGQGGDLLSALVLAEELARTGSVALGGLVAAQAEVAVPLLLELGDPGAGAEVARELVAGRRLAAVAPAHAHDDHTGAAAGAGPEVTARPDPNHPGGLLLTGTTAAVDAGQHADLLLLTARTGPQATAVIAVDLDQPGVTRTAEADRVGRTGAGAATLTLDAVRVPAAGVLGEGEPATAALQQRLVTHRLLVAATMVAAAGGLLERTRSYTRDRHAFGRPIGSFQVTRHRLVDLATAHATAEALLDQLVLDHLHGAVDPADLARAELTAGRVSFELADGCLQLHGGYGYSREVEVERIWRDLRLTTTDGGGEDLRRQVVADQLLHDGRPTVATGVPGPAGRPGFTPEHEALRARARGFVTDHLLPHVDRWERDGGAPRELFRQVADAGLLGLRFGPEVGGSGPDPVAQAVWIEELARTLSGGLAADLGASTDLCGLYVATAGDAEQRARLLPPLLTGARIGALAITEPGAGSDVAGITTRARRRGGGWQLDGTKVFITNGSWCDDLVVAATVTPQDGAPTDDPHGRITLFHVRADDAGVSRRRLPMLGWHASHTGELTFVEVTLDDDRRLGEIGSGFGHIMTNFAWERLVMALGAVASADRVLELTLAEAGPLPAARHHELAELETRVRAARALTDRALVQVVAREAGADLDPMAVVRTVSMAKLATQRLAFEVADACLRMAGPAATRLGSPLQRAWRDARLGPIGGGTDEIMREIIARSFGR